MLWFLTMNQTKVSPDLASRGMPIRLYYEGDPAQRVFEGPIHSSSRLSIAPKFLVNCSAWLNAGSHLAAPSARVGTAVNIGPKMIGGILEACGFPEFLGNAAEASAEFNTELGDLAAVAEWVVKHGNSAAFVTAV